MADEIDRANELAQKELDAAIAAARGIQPADAKSADCCIECGGEISSMRQQAIPGVQTCTECGAVLEAKALRGLM